MINLTVQRNRRCKPILVGSSTLKEGYSSHQPPCDEQQSLALNSPGDVFEFAMEFATSNETVVFVVPARLEQIYPGKPYENCLIIPSVGAAIEVEEAGWYWGYIIEPGMTEPVCQVTVTRPIYHGLEIQKEIYPTYHPPKQEESNAE